MRRASQLLRGALQLHRTGWTPALHVEPKVFCSAASTQLRWLSSAHDTPSVDGVGPDDPITVQLVRSREIKGTPLSQAVAMMLSAGQLPRPELLSNLEVLCWDLMDSGVHTCSTTELSAFCEVLRQVNYVHQPVLSAILSHLAGGRAANSSSSSTAQPPVSSMQVDELPSVLWAAARLHQARRTAQTSNRSSNSSSRSNTAEDSSIDCTQGSSCSGDSTGSNDSSSSCTAGADAPHVEAGVLDTCVKQAAATLGAGAGDLAVEEVPCVMQALADLEYEDPFLLTVMSEVCQEHMPDFSTQELQQLVQACVDLARRYYDGSLLRGLEGAVATKAAGLTPEVAAHVEQQLVSLRHKGHRQALEQQQEVAGAKGAAAAASRVRARVQQRRSAS